MGIRAAPPTRRRCPLGSGVGRESKAKDRKNKGSILPPTQSARGGTDNVIYMDDIPLTRAQAGVVGLAPPPK